MTTSKFIGLEISIEESKNQLLQQYNSMETIKKSIRDFVNFSGAAIAFFGFVKVALNQNDFPTSCWFILLFSLAIISYLSTIVISNFLLLPKPMETPIFIKMSNFEKVFIGKSQEVVLKNQLKQYTKAIENNRSILDHAEKHSRICAFFHMATIFFIFASFLVK